MSSNYSHRKYRLAGILLLAWLLIGVIWGLPALFKGAPAIEVTASTRSGVNTGLENAQNSRNVYLALGDSVAYGVGASPPEQQGYPAVFFHDYLQRQAGNNLNYLNLAVPGETTDSFISRPRSKSQLERAVAEIEAARATGHKVSLITLTIGGNDVVAARASSEAGKKAALERFDANFQKILNELVARDAGQSEIIVTTYYNPFAYQAGDKTQEAAWARQFNQVIRQRARDFGIKVADFYEPVVGREGSLTWIANGDIHPNAAGHRLLAEQVWKAAGRANRT